MGYLADWQPHDRLGLRSLLQQSSDAADNDYDITQLEGVDMLHQIFMLVGSGAIFIYGVYEEVKLFRQYLKTRRDSRVFHLADRRAERLNWDK